MRRLHASASRSSDSAVAREQKVTRWVHCMMSSEMVQQSLAWAPEAKTIWRDFKVDEEKEAGPEVVDLVAEFHPFVCRGLHRKLVQFSLQHRELFRNLFGRNVELKLSTKKAGQHLMHALRAIDRK